MANHNTPSPAYQRLCVSNSDHYQTNNETKLLIIIDSEAPVTTKIPKAPGQLTLKEFKDFVSLQDECYKFYFQSHDPEFGLVKEELLNDDAILPVENGRVVAWVLSNNSTQSAALFQSGMESDNLDIYQTQLFKTGSTNDSPKIARHMFTSSQPPSPAYNYSSSSNLENCKRSPPESPSCIQISLRLDGAQPLGLGHVYPGGECQTDGIIVDHVQPNSIVERDGRIKSGDKIVEVNGISLKYLNLSEAIRIFKQFVEQGNLINLVIQRPGARLNPTKISSLTKLNHGPRVPPRPPARDSSLTLNHLIVPKTKSGFDPATELPDPIIDDDQSPGIERCVTKTARPQPIINFHRNSVCRDQQKVSQSLPRSLTPRSWYTTGNLDNMNSLENNGIYQMDSRSDYEPTTPVSLRSNLYQVPLHCGKDDVQTIYMALKADSINLDIKDREWLRVVVKDAFLGSTLIKWLSRNIYGFCNRSEVKRYANQMLALGLIKSPMSKATFSEKCFYTLT